jgi:hypothetical protein
MIAETAAKGIRVLDAGWFDFFCPSHIQSNYKAKKTIVFLGLAANRGLEVLCSCHSIARPSGGGTAFRHFEIRWNVQVSAAYAP